MDQKHKKFREFWLPFLLRVIRKNPRSMYARVSKVLAQFVLKIEKLSHIMGPTPILEMARAYGLRSRLWLLSIPNLQKSFKTARSRQIRLPLLYYFTLSGAQIWRTSKFAKYCDVAERHVKTGVIYSIVIWNGGLVDQCVVAWWLIRLRVCAHQIGRWDDVSSLLVYIERCIGCTVSYKRGWKKSKWCDVVCVFYHW